MAGPFLLQYRLKCDVMCALIISVKKKYYKEGRNTSNHLRKSVFNGKLHKFFWASGHLENGSSRVCNLVVRKIQIRNFYNHPS